MATPLESMGALTIGWIEQVTASSMRVGLLEETPQATALNAGAPRSFPRINSYVLIPNEAGAVVAVTQQISIVRRDAPGNARDRSLVALPEASRMMTVVPLGTLVRGAKGQEGLATYRLERGVPALPSVGDPVLLPTTLQLRSIVEAADDDRLIRIGTAPFAGDANVWIHPDRLFGRHLAVLGNTGSGKSCSVAGLIRWSIEAAKDKCQGHPNARIIILDPNGEYGRAFPDSSVQARRYAVGGGDGARPLRVPGWLWRGQEWAAFATAQGQTQRPMLLRAIRELRNAAAPREVDPGQIATRIRSFEPLAQRYRENTTLLAEYASRQDFGANVENLAYEIGQLGSIVLVSDNELSIACTDCAGSIERIRESWVYTNQAGRSGYSNISVANLDALLALLRDLLPSLPFPERTHELTEDAPIPFALDELPGRIRAVAANSPGGGSAVNNVEPLVNRIEVLLGDQRLRQVIDHHEGLTLESWLSDLLGPTLESPEPVSIIDLSMVPSDVTHIVVAVIGRLVFEALQRMSKQSNALLPTILVLEEAHTFVRKDADQGASAPAADACRETFERIAREGRKFGLGLVLASQRPAELSATVLAQCNSFLLHRIVNDEDQRLVRRLVPDSLGGLFEELPVLPSQQAILMGWAVPTPILVKMRTLEKRPRSDDPSFWACWNDTDNPVDWTQVAEEWLGRRAPPGS